MKVTNAIALEFVLIVATAQLAAVKLPTGQAYVAVGNTIQVAGVFLSL